MRSPGFWTQPTWVGRIIAPLGWIFGAITALRRRWITPVKVTVPVICVGNLTMGGSGKTPTVIQLVTLTRSWGYVPHILSRGYGGSLAKKATQPFMVDAAHHIAAEVGDEPLLLSRHACTWVHRNRVLSAKKAIEAGATLLIMDDGLQNPGLYQDLKIAVFDGRADIGNGQIFPAGPLREFLRDGLRRVDACLLIHFKGNPLWLTNSPFQGKVLQGHLETTFQPVKNKRYIAFAGIGYPEKFFQTLEEQGFELAERVSFPDHHVYTNRDIECLESIKQKYTSQKIPSEDIMFITTEKDAVKLPGEFKKELVVLPIELHIKEIEWLRTFLSEHRSISFNTL